MKRIVWLTAVLIPASVILLCGTGFAATIVGATQIFVGENQSWADDIEAWLGEGPITLELLFQKQPGDTSADFHLAADNKGRTISVIEETTSGSFIGGYNPVSWESIGTYSDVEPSDGSFIFNLSEGDVRYQTGSAGPMDNPSHGPSFGGGHDIYVNYYLNDGYTWSWSYLAETKDGAESFSTGSSLGLLGNIDHNFGKIEVFTISFAEAPLPPAVWLLGSGLLGLIGFRRKK